LKLAERWKSGIGKPYAQAVAGAENVVLLVIRAEDEAEALRVTEGGRDAARRLLLDREVDVDLIVGAGDRRSLDVDLA
jgi:hypothetical protein